VGLSEHIREAYYFLANNYSPGDSIFLIGFSRGSFTARSIGGLIGNLGLLNKKGLPYFYEIFLDWENAGNPESRKSSFWEHYRDPLDPGKKSMPQTPSNDPSRVYEYLNEYRASTYGRLEAYMSSFAVLTYANLCTTSSAAELWTYPRRSSSRERAT